MISGRDVLRGCTLRGLVLRADAMRFIEHSALLSSSRDIVVLMDAIVVRLDNKIERVVDKAVVRLAPVSNSYWHPNIGHRGPGYALISSEQLHHTLIGRVVNTTISLRCCKQNVLKSRRQMPMQCFRFAFKYDGATTRSMAQWTAPKYSHPMKHGSAVARADAYDQRCTFLVCTHDM